MFLTLTNATTIIDHRRSQRPAGRGSSQVVIAAVADGFAVVDAYRLFRVNRDVVFWLTPGGMRGCRRIVSGASDFQCSGSQMRFVRRA